MQFSKLPLLLGAVAALTALLLGAAAPLGQASSVRATDAASFAKLVAAAKPGDTIQLADGVYPPLGVKGKQKLTIVGGPGARVAGLTLDTVTSVTVQGLTITPNSTFPSNLRVVRSSGVTLTGLHVDGHTESAGATVLTDPSDQQVTITGSDFTNCGSNQRCVAPGATGLVVSGNTFHDCYDCDFIRGVAGGPTTIDHNTFDRAVTGTCTGGPSACNHNDHIQIMGGGPWTVTSNTFGDRDQGAASVWVNTTAANAANPAHDVTIASNSFGGNAGYFAVEIEAGPGVQAAMPRNVQVVGNSILSGTSSAVRIDKHWSLVPPATRPVVSGNVLGVEHSVYCALGQFNQNRMLHGDSCPGNTVG